MSSNDTLKYQRMQERLEALQKEKTMSENQVEYHIPNTTSGNYQWQYHPSHTVLFPQDTTTNVQPQLQPAPIASMLAILTHAEHETIRQIVRGELAYAIQYQNIREIVREEIRDAVYEYAVLNGKMSHLPYPKKQDEAALDSLLTAIHAEPSPDDEIVAILAEYSEAEFEALVQRVKGMKRQ